MRVLVVSRAAPNGKVSPFVRDQAGSVASLGVSVEFLPIAGPGLRPYLAHPLQLARRVAKGDVDVVHAYYGLSGLTTLFESRAPLVMSFLGCDFNTRLQRLPARLLLCRKAKVCVFMNRHMHKLSGGLPHGLVLPFGVDLTRFVPADKAAARQALGLDPHKPLVLFASSFDRAEKNPALAHQTISQLGRSGATLVEFKVGYTPAQVVHLYNACDALLLTSLREGSPQVVKEAMACGLPVVSTPVGDVPWLVGDTPGCHLAAPSPKALADALLRALDAPRTPAGRDRLQALSLDLRSVAERLTEVYARLART